MPSTRKIEQAYRLAKTRYEEYGVNADAVMKRLARIPISLNAWQGDDVIGFEQKDASLKVDMTVTGNYPGRARTADELRADLAEAIRLIPCKSRVSLQAFHAENTKRKDRNEYGPENFSTWTDWAESKKIALDFNGTYFNHPMAAGGFTLASHDKHVRRFWVEHGIACRRIGSYMGRKLGTPCVTNIWVPDGMKDIPADRQTPRELLKQSLDEILAVKKNTAHILDAVEGKLFGIGSESYTVGSHEFYLAYAVKKGIMICMDTGHYHPTESVADKISAIMCNLERVLFHVSRGVRWDSDHVVVLSDELKELALEIVRGDYLDRVHFGLDFFDATINRVAAWIIGSRAALKALLMALLEPRTKLKKLENKMDYTARLALMEELKSMPFGAIWDYYCLQNDVPVGDEWLNEVKNYEKRILAARK